VKDVAEVPTPQTAVTLVEGSFDERIIGFEVFKHYMTILEEKNYTR
jgi:hypothetical protein